MTMPRMLLASPTISALLLCLTASTAAASSDLRSSPVAGFRSPFGVEIDVSNSAHAYLVDDSPCEDGVYRARFYLNVGTANSVASSSFETFYGRDQNDHIQIIVQVITVSSSGSPASYLRLHAADEAETLGYKKTTSIPLQYGWHSIEFEWRASDPGLNNGSLDLWIDGVVPAVSGTVSLQNLDNEDATIDTIDWGFVGGSAPDTALLHLDRFESRRDGSTIGPDESPGWEVPGDWDGDGKADFIIFRAGAWSVFGEGP